MFIHLLRAGRERERLCQILNVLMKRRVAADADRQAVAQRIVARRLLALSGTRTGAFLGVVAVGCDLSFGRNRRYSAASVNSPSMISELALSSLRAMLSLCRSISRKIPLRRDS